MRHTKRQKADRADRKTHGREADTRQTDKRNDGMQREEAEIQDSLAPVSGGYPFRVSA